MKTKSKNLKDELNRVLLYLAFSIYLILLIWVIFFKCGNPRSIVGGDYTDNPLAFGKNMNIYMSYNLKERFLYDFIAREDSFLSVLMDWFLNIFVFLFMGLYLPLIYKEINFKKCILTGTVVSIFFELYQLFTAFGSFSFFDILFNITGTAIGVLIFKSLYNLLNKKRKIQIILLI